MEKQYRASHVDMTTTCSTVREVDSSFLTRPYECPQAATVAAEDKLLNRKGKNMSKVDIREILGNGQPCEGLEPAWYDEITVDFQREDSENGTGSADSLGTVNVNFRVPEKHVATITIGNFTVDDWGHLSIYRKGETEKLLHLGMDAGIDGEPGERGGHEAWTKTGSVQLIPGDYVIEINQENADYIKGDPRFNVSKCKLTLTATKIAATCDVVWPLAPLPLGSPITWYEIRSDDNGVEYKYNTGTINKIFVEEFAAMARVIFAEAGTVGEEMKAIASVMLNRLGNSRGGTAYRRPVLSMLDEFNQRNSAGGNPNWTSVTDSQYASVEGDKCYNIDTPSCKKLKAAITALQEEIANGPSYPYDQMRTAGSAQGSHVTIGRTDFLTKRTYAVCDIKPANWDSLGTYPGSPLDDEGESS